MPKPAHNKITFSGIYGDASAPTEIWQWSLNTGPAVFASAADRQSFADRMRDAWALRIKPIQPSDVKLTSVRVAQVLEGGLVSRNVDGGYNQADSVMTVQGTNPQTAQMPLQTALAVTLETARAGATGKGRIFLPWPGFTLDGTWRLTQANADTVRTAVRSLINDINLDAALVGATKEVQVVSSLGYLSRVTHVSVGRAPDTMRSRRSALKESRVRVAL